MRTDLVRATRAMKLFSSIALFMALSGSGALAQSTSPAPPPAVQPDNANRPRELSTEEVEQQIQQKLRSEPALTKFDIRAKASENSVVLAGTVDTDEDRALAAGIVQSFAGKRKIVDHITVRETGSPRL